MAGGNISRSLPGVRGIRFELELELLADAGEDDALKVRVNLAAPVVAILRNPYAGHGYVRGGRRMVEDDGREGGQRSVRPTGLEDGTTTAGGCAVEGWAGDAGDSNKGATPALFPMCAARSRRRQTKGRKHGDGQRPAGES